MSKVAGFSGRWRVRSLGAGLVTVLAAASMLTVVDSTGPAVAAGRRSEPNEQSKATAPMASRARTRQAVIDAAFASRGHAAASASLNGDTNFALAPTVPLPQCVYGTIWNWPKVYENGTSNPCWVRAPGGTNMHLVGPTPSQTLQPNSSLHIGVADSYGGWENKAAYLLSWNNLWDYQPLMGGSNGAVGNDYTDQSLFVIPPQIDNSGCYDATQAYLYGRFVADCALQFGRGPYYGTPAGQTMPYTRFVGSSWAGGRYNSPFPSNCSGTCALNFSYYSPAYMEMPIFIEPSPYAGIGQTKTGATVNFTDNTLADLQETSWQWDFGDGKLSSEQNPIHNYDKPGTYTAKLTVHVSDGQSSTASTTVDVTQQYKLSGTVKDLSQNGVATTLTLTNLGDATTQMLNVASDGKYAVAVDPGSYKVATDPAAPTGFFTPKTRTVTVTNANKVANFTANARRVNVTMTDNIGRPVTGIAIPITPAATTYGSLVTNGAGTASVEVANGTYVLTPTDPHPGQGFQFVPPTRTVVVAGADGATSFVYKAAVFVSAVTPNVGGAKGGNTVTVSGGGFKQGGVPSVTAVKFQKYPGKAVSGSNIVVNSDSQLTVTAPKANSLLGASDTSVSTDLLVTSGAYTSGVTTDDVYEFGNVPEVTAVQVNDGPIIGGTKIKLTGRHFTGATAVTFEPVDTMPVRKAATFTVDSDTQISVTVPGHAYSFTGKHVADVRVRTPEGKSPTGFADHFNYREVHVVQLGDSIASGEGINYGFTYDSATGLWAIGNPNPTWDGAYQLCHQAQAYSRYVTLSIGGSLTTFACTGGTYLQGIQGDAPTTASPAQFGNWPGGANVNAAYDTANPDVVLISLGADDIEFSAIVADCIKSVLLGPIRCVPGHLGATINADFYGNLPGVGTHLRQLILDIQARGKASPGGVAPRIVVQDYYDPWPTNPAANCPDNNDLTPAQVPILKGLVSQLDNKIRSTVNAIVATDKTVAFVEQHDAFVGHLWCDPDPWAYGISIRTAYPFWTTNQAPFHPTVAGQQAMAIAVTPKVQGLLKPSK